MSNPNQVSELEAQRFIWDCVLANRDNPLRHRLLKTHIARLREATRQSLLAEIAKRAPENEDHSHKPGSRTYCTECVIADAYNAANREWRKLLTELAEEGDKSKQEPRV